MTYSKKNEPLQDYAVWLDEEHHKSNWINVPEIKLSTQFEHIDIDANSCYIDEDFNVWFLISISDGKKNQNISICVISPRHEDVLICLQTLECRKKLFGMLFKTLVTEPKTIAKSLFNSFDVLDTEVRLKIKKYAPGYMPFYVNYAKALYPDI